MTYTPRTIALLADLVHPPQTVDARELQRFHNEQYESGSPIYSSYQVTPEGAVLSNPALTPGGQSSVAFLPDRMRFREELSSLTHEEFGARVRTVAEAVAKRTGVQLFTAMQVTVRSLVNPRRFQDSRAYLRAGLFGLGGELSDFGREPQLYGMRLVFPPTPEEPNAQALRIESLHSDPRSLFLENQGSFGPLIVAHGLGPIEENVQAAYRFLVERALPFVARFDARQEA